MTLQKAPLMQRIGGAFWSVYSSSGMGLTSVR